MASATSNPSATGPLANRPQGPLTLRIEPPSTWFELRLEELWKYRELLFFLVWRDVKVRYKQTAIGIAWVIVQPLLTMLVATLFLAGSPSSHPRGCLIPSFVSRHWCPGLIFRPPWLPPPMWWWKISA